MTDLFYTSKDGKNTVHACLWTPAGEAKGVVQIIHGMSEYAEDTRRLRNFSLKTVL